MTAFKNREDAGIKLASELSDYAGSRDLLVLALPRGGVPVAYEVAGRLNAPLDVFLVRKLGVPGREELAMGSIAHGDVTVVNKDIVEALGISRADIERVSEIEKRELERREKLYRGDKPFPRIKDRIIILVDDGLATGASMRAAVKALKGYNPAKIVVAVPTGALSTCRSLGKEVDNVVCVESPEYFGSVGSRYLEFPQVSDQEVTGLLHKRYEEVRV